MEAVTSVDGRRSAQGPCPHASDHELNVVSDEKFSKQPQNVIDLANLHQKRTTLLKTAFFTLYNHDTTTKLLLDDFTITRRP